jgi:hypothetical protein
MSIRLILDTTALTAYVGDDLRALELGELMAGVTESDNITGIPALCFIAAYQQATRSQRDHLLALAGHDDGPAVVLPLLAADVAPVAELATTMRYDLAQAASAAAQHDALLGTYDRAPYKAVVHDDDILDL